MATQTLVMGIGVSGVYTLDIYPIAGGAAISTALAMTVDADNPQAFVGVRIGTNAGWFMCVLKESGVESFNSPWYVKLRNANGVYLLSTRAPTQDELEENIALIGSAMTLQDAAIKEETFDPPAEPSGPAEGMLSKLDQIWRSIFKRHRKNGTASGVIETYKDDGTTVATTQDFTSASGVDDVGAAT